MAGGWVYILASRYRGTLYTGITSDIARRICQHRDGSGSGFAKRYEVVRLVFAERHEGIDEAITREQAIKKWRREWKIELIEQANPDWNDLFDVISA